MIWRVGRKLGRTLYKRDVCVGLVDTPGLALEIVEAMNRGSAAAPVERQPVQYLPPAVPTYLTTKEAAKRLCVSVKHLEALRARGAGPPYLRVGKAVRYPAATLTEKRKQ